MTIRKVHAVYFSPVGSTKETVETIAGSLAATLSVPMQADDFTLPQARDHKRAFEADELVVFGTPTYAGRIPNKALPFVKELFAGNGTPAVAVVTFGNRNFDSSLTELAAELGGQGFQVIAAGGFVSRHVFSALLAPGRPDENDRALMHSFAGDIAKKVTNAKDMSGVSAPVIRNNAEIKPYYTPLTEDMQPAKFLPAKPKTKEGLCDRCGICVQRCPLGSIDADCITVSGVCIKCHACIHFCPVHARYFDDAALQSHIRMLEENYTRRAEAELYL